MPPTRVLLAAAALLAGCSSGPSPAPSAEAPSFRLATVDGASEMALADAVRAAGGKPLVLVLGSHDCPYSTQEVEELATSKPDYAVVAVVQGTPQQVKASLPAAVPFPVLVDAAGATLGLYAVEATPSVVVLDGKGGMAYRGPGGYIPPARIAEMAARVARGEPPGEVAPEGG